VILVDQAGLRQPGGSPLRVDWCPTECLTMDHFRLTPAEERESVDLAIVAD
jgi:hypothetical protein